MQLVSCMASIVTIYAVAIFSLLRSGIARLSKLVGHADCFIRILDRSIRVSQSFSILRQGIANIWEARPWLHHCC